MREANEDRYFIKKLEDQSLLFAVADGLGGQATGDYAAEIMRGILAGIQNIFQGNEQQYLSHLATETDLKITNKTDQYPELEGMGTTILCVLLRDKYAYWVHVGDSRLNLFRDNQLIQVTQDQNYAQFSEGTLSTCSYIFGMDSLLNR